MKSKKEDSKADNVPRVIINLKKCSQNWKSLPQEVLPQKPLYKRQEKRKIMLKKLKNRQITRFLFLLKKLNQHQKRLKKNQRFGSKLIKHL